MNANPSCPSLLDFAKRFIMNRNVEASRHEDDWFRAQVNMGLKQMRAKRILNK